MTEPAGWFGKMPALGDFASRRLPPHWLAQWDDWLQHELVRSRAALGDDAWLAAFLVAPVRRFWLAAGLLTAEAWLGLLMPSVDAAGRHFPFTLARPLAGRDELADAWAQRAWLDAADAVARQVLDPAFGVDALEQALRLLPAAASAPVAASQLAQPGLLPHALATRRPPPRSAWWCEGAQHESDFVCCSALPTGAAFDALLHDGGQHGGG